MQYRQNTVIQLHNRLTGCIQSVGDITAGQCHQMYSLMASHFDQVTQLQFEQDLVEKEWVILLHDTTSGQIRGFSTLMRLQATIDGQPIVAFFSGDTIIQREYWGQTELPRLWGQQVFKLAAAIPHRWVYWFLISSGYKTYRFLPVFFREFYPTYRCSTPPHVQKILDALAQLKFPNEYDANRGVIRLSHAAPLLPGIAELTEQRLKDPHIAFFVRANPGHVYGEELACLTQISPANLTRAGRRMLGL